MTNRFKNSFEGRIHSGLYVFRPTNFFHHSRLSEDMNKKPGIVKALICDLGLKTLKLPSKDRSSTAGREENGPCAATPYKTPGEDLANGALSDVGTGMQTESESEAEYDVPVGSDAEGEKDCARWKMDIKFLLNEEDVEPEHSGGAGGLQGGGETIPHCTDDNGTVLIWWEGATKAKNKQKEGASSAKNRGSNGVGKDDDIETQSSLSVSSSQWNFWDDGADRTT